MTCQTLSEILHGLKPHYNDISSFLTPRESWHITGPVVRSPSAEYLYHVRNCKRKPHTTDLEHSVAQS